MAKFTVKMEIEFSIKARNLESATNKVKKVAEKLPNGPKALFIEKDEE